MRMLGAIAAIGILSTTRPLGLQPSLGRSRRRRAPFPLSSTELSDRAANESVSTMTGAVLQAGGADLLPPVLRWERPPSAWIPCNEAADAFVVDRSEGGRPTTARAFSTLASA